MILRCSLVSLVFAVAVASNVCGQQPWVQPRPNSQRLGILGGLVGAGIGVAIGEDGGDAVPGAIMGGAIGALSGAAVGDSIDQQQAHRQAIIYAQQHQMAQAVTLADVVTMTRAGLADSVIINQIRAKGMLQPLTTNDLIMLKQQGVSDHVITAMQQRPYPVPAVVAPRPVVVDNYHYCRPYPVRHHWHYHHPRHHHHPRTTFHIGFGH